MDSKKILETAATLKDDITQFLRDIVAIPSNENEKKAVLRCKTEMEKLGYDEVIIDGMGNLLGRIGSGKKVIAFDGHIDTVAPGGDNWKRDPFDAHLEDGYIYGRGTTDQKGGIASIIYSTPILLKAGIPDDVTVWHSASIREEEFEGANWEYIIDKMGLKPDLMVLTEPTNLDICIGQRGRIDFKIVTKGISSHGANPHLGDNAVYKMAAILKDIEALNEKFKVKPVLGKGTIIVSGIKSWAPSINAVPYKAEIHIDRRLTMGETLETAMKELENLESIKQAGAKIFVPDYFMKTYTGLSYPVSGYYSTWLMDEDHYSVKNAVSVYEELFDKSPTVRPWNFSTNGVITKGKYDIPTIGFGPSDELLAHTVDEKVSVDHLVKSSAFYAAYVLGM